MFNIEAAIAAYNKLSFIHYLVVKLEHLLPGTGQGATKLDIALNSLQAGAADVIGVGQTVEQFRTETTAQVNAAVSTYKATGFPTAAELPSVDNVVIPKLSVFVSGS